MITALDTSVLLDIFVADAKHGPASREAVRRCVSEGRLVACDVVWAEIGSAFRDSAAARQAMQRLDVDFVPLDVVAALEAADAWRSYRARGGPRARVAADFLVGAHALVHADRLLTRDRGFFRACFRGLSVVQPK